MRKFFEIGGVVAAAVLIAPTETPVADLATPAIPIA